MKTKLLSITLLLAAGLALTACSKDRNAEMADASREVYQDSRAAVTNAWDNLKSFTYEKRSDFDKQVKAMETKLEAEISEMRSKYSEAKASASRKAAMAELKDAESDYKQKMSAVGSATADTWDAAKDNVVTAWDRLQAAYAKARAE